MSINIVGISAYYHDSAAALLIDGDIIAAAQEERFTRKKHDASFPQHALNYCLSEANLSLSDIDYVVFYDKPLVKFERLLESYLSYAPIGFRSFLVSMPIWLKEKLFLKNTLKKELSVMSGLETNQLPTLLFTQHHHSHAASAFYPSPFEKAAILCLDGVGEWATSSVWLGEHNQITPQWEIQFPHSLGLLYSAFTYHVGFKVNSGEYKLMGLAPYGEPVYVDLIYDNLIDVKEDGTFRLNMKYFNYVTGLTMTNKQFSSLFGGSPRQPESAITQREMNLARSIQVVVEEILLKLARTLKNELQTENLCLAGGVALNCVANGRLLKEAIFKNIWIQPAAGDAGSAIGAAYAIWHEYLEKPRDVSSDGHDKSQGSFLGPSYSNDQIRRYLDSVKASYEELEDKVLLPKVAYLLSRKNVVGWFQGRMEFGPRALGGRSILGDARSAEMQATMNLKIKYRESFRPFAPAIRSEKVTEWFDLGSTSPYMLLVAKLKQEKQIQMTRQQQELSGIDQLKIPRSTIPAVTHVDYSARVQTVDQETNPVFYQLLCEFEKITGCPVLINTSFNVRGEPIVCSPEDAYQCFMRTEMDYLVLGNFLLEKLNQPKWKKDEEWKKEFALD